MAHFDEFTSKYALSKTLRFELKPVGWTREHMLANKVLLKDEIIEKSYQTLKPVMDKIHERFIAESLESETAKQIDFCEYIESYISEKQGNTVNIDSYSKTLREQFSLCFDITANIWKEQVGKNDKSKDILADKSYKILTELGILEYIKKYVDDLSDEVTSREMILDAIKEFERFFTYFTGFNQNRENYYTTKEEKSTAIATRIVHVNLPKFCDNMITFDKRKDEYLWAYATLDKTKQIKDVETNTMIPIYPITEDYFYAFHYNKCLSQKEIEEYNRVIGHYNSLINLYNQQQVDKNKKLAGFKTLYKQIGCGSKKALFFQITHDFLAETENKKQSLPEAISLQEILLKVEIAGEKYFFKRNEDQPTVDSFIEDIRNRTDWTGYYWSKAGFNTISSWYFADWQTLAEKLKKTKDNPNGIWDKTDKNKEAETGEKVKVPDVINLSQVFAIIDKTPDWKTGFFRERIREKKNWTDENDKIDKEKEKIFNEANAPSEVIIKLLCLDIEREMRVWKVEKSAVLNLTEYHSEESKALIKAWMDHTVNIFRMIKYFAVSEGKIKGEPMNAGLSEYLKTLLYPEPKEDADWYNWYDGLRNYLTKKVGEEEKENKLKLNFENSTLAAGWDINKEWSNSCVLLQDSTGKQYLAVMIKGNKTVFQKEIGGRKNITRNPLYTENEGCTLKKMEYKLLPGPNKMLPKCLMPTKDPKKYWASDSLLEMYKKGCFKKSESSFNLVDLYRMVDFYKEALPKYEDWKLFNFKFKPTDEYQDISQFYSDVEKQGYKLGFQTINEIILDELVESGKIYLFEIKNQDSNAGKKEGHKENLHTLYWKAIFSDVPNRPKLNGEAEIFCRKAIKSESLKKKIVNGKEIIENFRYSQEKFLFHVPITLNFCLKDEKINDKVQEYISEKPLTFLGIDRGEKHLAYYSLVDQTGNIIEQRSLNLGFIDKDGNPRYIEREKIEIGKDGKEIKTMVKCWDYNDILDTLSGNRDYARKNWKTIGTIKEMKEGYISQVVNEIVKLATKNNALIVLEDLNTGFKRGRQKIEKSIYQKFELALAKKLNFVVDKSVPLGEIGSVTKALQLTPPVQNYGDIENRKQVGIMLYTRANYTSQTDPLTGWRRSIYLKYDAKDSLKCLYENFQSIEREEDGHYIFTTLPNEKTGISWRLTSQVDRFVGGKNERGKWEQVPFDCVKTLNEIFWNDLQWSILDQISLLDLHKWSPKILQRKTAVEGLIFIINTLMQIRNSDGKEGMNNDFLHSPIIGKIDANGKEDTFIQFDSRIFWKQIDGKETIKNSLQKPVSWDANGAYNIARKGVIMAEHIRVKTDQKDLNLFVSDVEWDLWLTNKSEWKKQLSAFASRKQMEDINKKK